MVKKLLSAMIILGLVGLFSTTLNAADVPAKKKKQTPQGLYLTPKEAHDMKTANPAKVLFVDVRTPEELYFVGYAVDVDKNIPLAYVDYSRLNKKGKKFASAKNKNLIAQLDAAMKAKGLTKEDPAIFICRSGDRSATAATMANKAGYKKAYTITTGTEGDKSAEKKRTVNGWKNDGLPWTYKFNKDLFQYEKPFN
jgi:rhodanese-related sulfurtransferase